MIKVKATITDGDVAVEVKGHAIGSEKVCSAVSAVVQTMLAGLKQIEKSHPSHLRVQIYKEYKQQQ